MVRPISIWTGEIGSDCLFTACRVPQNFAAGTDALIWLDMGASGDFLQKNFDGFCAELTFKGKDAGGFVHKLKGLN